MPPRDVWTDDWLKKKIYKVQDECEMNELNWRRAGWRKQKVYIANGLLARCFNLCSETWTPTAILNVFFLLFFSEVTMLTTLGFKEHESLSSLMERRDGSC